MAERLWWQRGQTLKEQARLVHDRRPSHHATTEQRAIAEARLSRWTQHEPFRAGGGLAQRLAREGLSVDDLLTLLIGVEYSPGEEPEWVHRLRGIYASPLPRPAAESPSVVQPLISWAAQEACRLTTRLDVPEAATRPIVDRLGAALRQRLRTLATPCFLLELNIARLEGRLADASPMRRYQQFVQALANPGVAWRFLQTYPVLARLLLSVASDWVAATAELAARLEHDRPILETVFNAGAPLGQLVGIEVDAGDAHDRGRSVSILHFERDVSVVYKPRPLAAAAHFQELLGWVDREGAGFGFRRLTVLDRGPYGWVEFVPYVEVTTRGQAAAFYDRVGGLLALLHVLQGTDFHYENLIANGEHPVLVDLETLFTPTLPSRGAEQDRADAFWTEIGSVVIATGLLPVPLFEAQGTPGIDLSGLGGAAGQLGGKPWPALVEEETDHARIEWRLHETRSAHNRLRLHGTPVRASDFADDVVGGFTRMWRFLQRHRDDLIAPGSVLESFTDDPIRIILRPTVQYAMLAQLAIHPDHLQDDLDRQALLDRLWPPADDPYPPPDLVESEIEQLARGDVPYFEGRPGTASIWPLGADEQAYRLIAPPLDEVKRRLGALSEAECKRQAWIVRSSLHVPELDSEPLRFPSYTLPDRHAFPDDAMMAAARIGDRLLELAFEARGEVRWITLASYEGRSWRVRDAELDLYEGISGIALFLAYLARVCGERRFMTAASRAAASVKSRAAEITDRRIGAFSGRGGVIYLLANLAGLHGDEEALELARTLALDAVGQIADDGELDVVGGSAGLVLCLLTLYQLSHDQDVLEVAGQAADHLLRSACPMPSGIAWRPLGGRGAPLTGFAHGAAGIALALWRLAGVCGDDRFRSAALAAVDYERSWFSPTAQNWPDLRDLPQLRPLADPSDGRVYLSTWCHGAPGVGLARSAMLTSGPAIPAAAKEIRAAARSTLQTGFGTGHVLCHGDLGNLETVRAAAAVLGDEALDERLEELTGRIVSSIRDRGPVCGMPRGLETPGLMTGLAGIGWGLLRLLAAEVVPDVLTLSPPPAVGGPSR